MTITWVETATRDRGRGLLHRDGHTAGAGRLRMSEQDWQALNARPVIRTDPEIDPGLIQVRHDLERLRRSDVASVSFLRAILAAVEWARGARAEAPASRRTTAGERPTWVEIAAEIDHAEDVIYRVVRDDRPQGWFVGVEHTLMYLIGDTADAPW